MRRGEMEMESGMIQPKGTAMRLAPKLSCILGQIPHLPEQHLSAGQRLGLNGSLLNHINEENASNPIWG